MSAWSHLPNAAHIDAVLEDARARPGVWVAASRAAWVVAWAEARAEARAAAQGAGRSAVRDTISWTVVRDAMRALIAWDESAALLDLTPDALRTIISSCDGDVKHQAVLLLPAVIARSTK